MKTLAFLDCPTGIAGDMCLGALVSAGVPLSYLQTQLTRLNLPETVELRAAIVHKNGIAATKVDVVLPHETAAAVPPPPLRHLHDIEAIITAAQLPERAIAWSLGIFRRLAIAEGAIHGIDPQQVHFHEVGATDAIVDIVGTCLGLDWLGIDTVYCAPLPTGRGTVRAAHGRLPVPAPAVLKLMEMAQVPIYNADLQGELVTPTGAAIATELATQFGDPPTMQLQKVGLGAGHKDLPIPNLLRLWIGQASNAVRPSPAHFHPANSSPAPHYHAPQAVPTASSETDALEGIHDGLEHPIQPLSQDQLETGAWEKVALNREPPEPPHLTSHVGDGSPSVVHIAEPVAEREARSGIETVIELATQVDDLSPQAIGYLYERLLRSQALDVFTQSVMMKKSRPGHLITVIADPEQADICEQILLQETTTLGVRRTVQTRHRLRREITTVDTPLGPIRMKLAFAPGRDTPLKVHPEYADCAKLAQQYNLPWREVHQQAVICWHTQAAAAPQIAPNHQES